MSRKGKRSSLKLRKVEAGRMPSEPLRGSKSSPQTFPSMNLLSQTPQFFNTFQLNPSTLSRLLSSPFYSQIPTIPSLQHQNPNRPHFRTRISNNSSRDSGNKREVEMFVILGESKLEGTVKLERTELSRWNLVTSTLPLNPES